jgi:predicted DNA-binding transcriptional regulator YafY
MNRIDRLSAILIQLQSRRVVRAQDIADRFEISLRTVYRDMKSLEEGGIPLIGEAGQGYSLADGYRLPPVTFTRDEAMAFITAEKLVGQLTDELNGASYQSAMYKVKAVLKTTEKDYLSAMESRIEVLKAKRAPHIRAGINPLQTILAGIAEKKVISLNYFSYYRQQHTQREVEPVGIFFLDNYWHLVAWCRSRQDYRDFRFDRMTNIHLTPAAFDDRHPTLKTYLDSQYQERNLQKIVICVDKKAALHLGEQRYYHGYIDEAETPKGIEMTFLTSNHIEGFVRWFISFADYATITEPDSLRERVHLILAQALKKLQP